MIDDGPIANSGSRYAGATSGPNVLHRLWSSSSMRRLPIAALALVIFAFDTLTKLDIIIPILYVNVVLLAMQSGRRRDVVIAGWSSIGLTIVSFLITFHPTQSLSALTPVLWIALLNNLLSFLAIISVMILCLKNIDAQTEILRARGRVAQVSRGMSLRAISASVVHEVSQPLTAIRTNAAAALRWSSLSPPNLDEARTASRRVVAEVERASHVIGSLRRLLMPGHISLERCDARALIEKAVQYLSIEIDEEGIDLIIICPQSLKMTADRVLIEQVVINCISNSIEALRAVEAGKRSISIEGILQSASAHIVIKDSGTGCDPSTLEDIFDPFFTTRKEEGMGMGLAISRSIIDAHGGKIRARLNSPQGLVIEIEIPSAGSP